MKKYRDEIAKVCHEMIKDGYSLGMVSDVEMKEFEEECFVPESTAKAPGARQRLTPIYTGPRKV